MAEDKYLNEVQSNPIMTNGSQVQKVAKKPPEIAPQKQKIKAVPKKKKSELEVERLAKEIKKLNEELKSEMELIGWYREYYGAPESWSHEDFLFSMFLSGGIRQLDMLNFIKNVNNLLAKKEKLFKQIEVAGIDNFTNTGVSNQIREEYKKLYWNFGWKMATIVETVDKMVKDKLEELEPKPLKYKPHPTISAPKEGPVIPR